MKQQIQDGLKTRANIQLRMAEMLTDGIASAVDMIGSALESGQTLFLCGNGGSAADSQHIAAEMIGRFERERQSYPAIALTTDTSALTSIGNDYGFENIFSRQIEGLAKQGDILIGISTSGGSKNVIKAMEMAKTKGMSIIAFTGANPGVMGNLADITIAIPVERTALVQEGHIAVGHLLCELVETRLTT
ncbi:D-sedoheptulose 7-phosphate isomerase [candidate division KSB1 bacterium]|nr:D-sedoheptulose 7-phosphate isomerase [candidate division KSB1 bacterium]